VGKVAVAATAVVEETVVGEKVVEETVVGEKVAAETAVGEKAAAAREPTAEEEMGRRCRGSMCTRTMSPLSSRCCNTHRPPRSG
jgi:hypothetical protein